MKIAFVHLSDIHFGQERGADLHINNDIKQAVIQDARQCVQSLGADRVEGVLITGDIAYSGKEEEYQAARHWLDQLTAAIGCVQTHVRIVPGNHDIDRHFISDGIGEMLEKITLEGENKLLRYLKNDVDRAALLLRFGAYQKFAEAYDCSLDTDGGWAGNHVVELEEGRRLRILGVNSALICKKSDKKGELLLGSKQLTLQPKTQGEELIVLTHHPLDWFSDAETASKYVRNRARFYLSGHEHAPAVKLERVAEDADLMMIASGATIPPTEEGPLKFCYNIIQFETMPDCANIQITVLPRKWESDKTEFVEDTEQLKDHGRSFPVRCPNFKMAEPLFAGIGNAMPQVPQAPAPLATPVRDDEFALAKLRFFMDLSESQRVEALIKLGALPENLRGGLSHSAQSRCLERLFTDGKLQQIKDYLDKTPI